MPHWGEIPNDLCDPLIFLLYFTLVLLSSFLLKFSFYSLVWIWMAFDHIYAWRCFSFVLLFLVSIFALGRFCSRPNLLECDCVCSDRKKKITQSNKQWGCFCSSKQWFVPIVSSDSYMMQAERKTKRQQQCVCVCVCVCVWPQTACLLVC